MKTIRILLLLPVLLLSCKKEHTCYCPTPDGNVPVFKYDGPRAEARKQCKAYVIKDSDGNSARCKLR